MTVESWSMEKLRGAMNKDREQNPKEAVKELYVAVKTYKCWDSEGKEETFEAKCLRDAYNKVKELSVKTGRKFIKFKANMEEK